MARHGLVATSQPLASAAGLQVLMEGGNAIDAAVTAAAVLSVVEPTMNGIGGNLFAIVRDGKTGTIAGLNASGRSGYAATPAEFARRGLTRIPYRGPLSVSVPGVVGGWARLLERYGNCSPARSARPSATARRLRGVRDYRAPVAGGRVGARARPGGGRDVPARRARARDRPGVREPAPRGVAGADRERAAPTSSTRGALAKAIVDDLQRRGGLLAMRDFADHHADWVEPISRPTAATRCWSSRRTRRAWPRSRC